MLRSLILLLALAAPLVFGEDADRALAPRSYPSGSVTCYYSCPPLPEDGYMSGGKQDVTLYQKPSTRCLYNDGKGGFKTCTYENESGGSVIDSGGSASPNCPNSLAPFCTSTAPNAYYYFRKRASKRVLMDDRIAARQYKPLRAPRRSRAHNMAAVEPPTDQ